MSHEAANSSVAARVEVEDGMGSPTWSLEHFMTMDVELPARVKAQLRAQQQLREAMQEEQEYWERLSSGVLRCDSGDLSTVADEWKEYARDWVKYGRDLDVIGDFAAHARTREERLDRRLSARERKDRATEAKLAAMATAEAEAVAAATPAAPAAARAGKKTAAPEPDLFVEQPAPALPFDPHVGLAILEAIEEPLRSIADTVCERPPDMSAEDRQLCIQGYNHMLEYFQTSAALKRKYGFNRADQRAPPLSAGGDVPSYFANVGGESIFRRKQLSMAGLRNLVIYGTAIYNQLRDIGFDGDIERHANDTGLSLMRRVTGNVVDLDTTVLRCNDVATLNAINALNKHKNLPLHANSNNFGSSKQAQEIAVNCALPLLEDFATALKLQTKDQRVARRIDPSQITQPVPVAGNNTDRGKHPVWQYVNAGQNSFHANVPTMSDVNGALLLAPLHCLRCWLQIHALFTDEAERTKRIHDFFERCVADSCFNGKWKSIEEYVSGMAHEGTIVDVLQRTQMAHQSIFTAAFFEADDDEQTNETKEMWRLANGMMAKEAQSGRMRAITEADVRAWVQDPSVTL